MGVLQQGSSLQEVIMFSQSEAVMLQACADKLEREIQLYCDPDKPGSPPVFPDEEPGAAVSKHFGPGDATSKCPSPDAAASEYLSTTVAASECLSTTAAVSVTCLSTTALSGKNSLCLSASMTGAS